MITRICRRVAQQPVAKRLFASGSTGQAASNAADDSDMVDATAVQARKAAALGAEVARQLGGNDDRAGLAQLLQRHGVVVKGGREEAIALLDALMVGQCAACT